MLLQGPNPGALTTDVTGVTIQSDGTQWWIVGTIAGTIPPRGVQGVATASCHDEFGCLRWAARRAGALHVVVPASGQLILILTAEASGCSDVKRRPVLHRFHVSQP